MTALTPPLLMQQIPAFLERIGRLMSTLGLDLSTYTADHIALRVNDKAHAQSLHKEWLASGKEISNNMINGRPIVVVKLDCPMEAGTWSIDCVELPYPGEKTYPEQGWEHIEWVIPSKATTPDAFLEDVLATFPVLNERWNTLDDLGVTVKLSSPSGDGERLPNPTVALKADGVCIKLHPVSLEAVIESEQ